MKKILVPVDFSTHTKTVCRYAIEIAKKDGGEIRLFHAYFDFVFTTNTAFPYSVESNEIFNQEVMVEVRDKAKKDMHNLHEKMVNEIKGEGLKNVRIVFTLTGGLPEEEILNISETYNPDLIIMGTHGKGEKDMFTGKVSSKVIQNASCRILTVPRNASYHGFNKVLYATDLKGDDENDLKTFIDLLKNYKPVVHCIHVDTDNDPAPDLEKMKKLKLHFSKDTIGEKVFFEVISHDNFMDCLDNYIKENQIDMLAVVHNRKGFLKRLFTTDHTRQLLYHSDVPLYIFPGK